MAFPLGPIIIASGALALLLSSTKKSRAAGLKRTPEPPSRVPLPPAGPVSVPIPAPSPAPAPAPPVPAPVPAPMPAPEPAPCPPEAKAFVEAAVQAIANRTATAEQVSRALPIAVQCFPQTASVLQNWLEGKKGVPPLVAQPDQPGDAIPIIDGKPAWFFDTRGGVFMALPNFEPILVMFRGLQAAIGGIRTDGRIGSATLSAFIKKMRSMGFTSFPNTVQTLAANAVKYTEVIKRGYRPINVAGTPLRRIPSHKFQNFARGCKTGKCGEVSGRGGLGMFNANPRRLERLGLMANVRPVDLEDGTNIVMGDFKDFELEEFLSSPDLQYQVFSEDMSEHARTILKNPKLKSLIGKPIPHSNYGVLTLSGFLGLAKAAGIKGALSWLKNPRDRERFPGTTEIFRRTNGHF